MPLLREPTTQELEDHFFGSGAFQYEWFSYACLDRHGSFPVAVFEHDIPYETRRILSRKEITQDDFIEGIKKYAESLEDRTFDDLIEDMDAGDVDNVIQLIMFGEIRYA